MAIENSNLMNIYSDIFLYLINDKNYKCNISKTLLYKYLNLNNLQCVVFNYPIILFKFKFKFDNFKNISTYINYY